MGKLKVLDLFSGIGGFSLGLERTGGFETIAFCEIDDFCRRVLAKHWPAVPCHCDVTKLRGEDVGAVDVICGGFPCQDISLAGLGAGLDGARSGLWKEFSRLIGELRPSFVLVENVSALLGRGMGVVLGDLAALGYDAEWHCIPASVLGAPHIRDRVWIIAHASGCSESDKPQCDDEIFERAWAWPNPAASGRRSSEGGGRGLGDASLVAQALETDVSDSDKDRLQEREHVESPRSKATRGQQIRRSAERVSSSPKPPHAYEGKRPFGSSTGRMGRFIESLPGIGDWPLTTEPVLDRGVDGVPHRVDRCGALGNAVVPQIPELIGNAILASIDGPIDPVGAPWTAGDPDGEE